FVWTVPTVLLMSVVISHVFSVAILYKDGYQEISFLRYNTQRSYMFDGSALLRGTSLNDHLESGLNLHVELMGILLRFRRFWVGLHPEERDACRFLWRDARGGKAPREYRLKRVCIRLTCSPFSRYTDYPDAWEK
ncbi:conserved hypothetical protein, partial [Trichinella spiralis]|uniref:hypothetical protein n=1 Tax=Trichinella spiralis TaxID=6334 RepID=UPI0001EFEDD2